MCHNWLSVPRRNTSSRPSDHAAADILRAGGVGGGGKPNLAQGGGKDVAQVPEQLRKMAEFLSARLESAMADTWST